SAYAASLFRGLTCHVSRTSPLLIVCGSKPCGHAMVPFWHAAMPAGVPSDTNVLAIGLLTVKKRPDPKNHSLFLTIGPPCVKSISRYVPILSTDFTPWLARNGVRLLL